MYLLALSKNLNNGEIRVDKIEYSVGYLIAKPSKPEFSSVIMY